MSEAEERFRQARDVWRAALREHVLAPPDLGFSRRLASLAAACDQAHRDGFEWPPARGGAQPPYELRPGTGRRGPAELWARFDESVAELDRVSEGRSIRAVGRAYAELAEVAGQLAQAIADGDRVSAKRSARPARRKSA